MTVERLREAAQLASKIWKDNPDISLTILVRARELVVRGVKMNTGHRTDKVEKKVGWEELDSANINILKLAVQEVADQVERGR